MAATELKRVLSVTGPDDMNYATCVFLLVQALQYEEIAIRAFIVDQIVSAVARFGNGAFCP
jgi:hypothetical protein